MWIAEDVPWYSVDRNERQPQTDEDAGMSAPHRLGKFETEQEARARLADHLTIISRYDFVVNGGERDMYLVAADAIRLGVDGIRISGRYHRVRKVV